MAPDVDLVLPEGIKYLSSYTQLTYRNWAEFRSMRESEEYRAHHCAEFKLTDPNAVLVSEGILFTPSTLDVEWVQGRLSTVVIRGPRINDPSFDGVYNVPLNVVAEYPVVSLAWAAIKAYELVVATTTAQKIIKSDNLF